MKSNIKITLLLSFLFFIFSCSEIKKQGANDDLIGSYGGVPVTVFQWSKLNIGIEDERTRSDDVEFVKIKKDSQDNLSLFFEDGMSIDLNNVQLATNGAIFNIPNQMIKMSVQGSTINGRIKGLSENFFGESKCDGIYDRESGRLSFSFSGLIKINQNGNEYEVPLAMGYYDFQKQN